MNANAYLNLYWVTQISQSEVICLWRCRNVCGNSHTLEKILTRHDEITSSSIRHILFPKILTWTEINIARLRCSLSSDIVDPIIGSRTTKFRILETHKQDDKFQCVSPIKVQYQTV